MQPRVRVRVRVNSTNDILINLEKHFSYVLILLAHFDI